MTGFVIDSSALFALIEEEPGADRVEQVLTEETAALPWLALMEVYYVTLQEQGLAEAETRYAALLGCGAEIVWEVDEPTILTAGRWKAQYRISLADSLIAATAYRRGATLLHKDPEYDALGSELNREALPYR